MTRAGHWRYLFVIPWGASLVAATFSDFPSDSDSTFFGSSDDDKPVALLSMLPFNNVRGSVFGLMYSRLKLIKSSGVKMSRPLASSPRCSGVVQSAKKTKNEC